MPIAEAYEGVDRRRGLTVVPDVAPAEDRRPQSGRRWDDRPGELATMTFTHLLTTRPAPEEALRLLVALLCWPIGAQGALVVSTGVGGPRIGPCYMDQVVAWPDVHQDDALPPEVHDILVECITAHTVMWSRPEGERRTPMAAWLLGSSADPTGVLVLFLSTPLEGRLVAMRANSLAEVLGLYLGGVGLDAPGARGRPSSACLGAEALKSRQLQILQMMADDLTNPQIASRIGFSTSTVRMESLAIYRALGVHDRQHAVLAGRALGLLQPA